MRTFVGGAGARVGCVIVTICPPTVSVAFREDVEAFAVAV
jgi:hypothetical protein